MKMWKNVWCDLLFFPFLLVNISFQTKEGISVSFIWCTCLMHAFKKEPLRGVLRNRCSSNYSSETPVKVLVFSK